MKVAVVYWSGTGNTRAMAEVLAEAAGADLLLPGSFSAAAAAEYDAVALGCPSMGAEELEDAEFAPMYGAVESALAGKPVALFGSYGWGDGEWMRSWEERAGSAGLTVIETIICQEAPGEDTLARLKALGATLAGK